MKALISCAIATLISGGTHTIVSSAIKYEDDSKILTLENKLKNVPAPKVVGPCINVPCDSIFYFEKGKIEGLKLCPKHKQKDCPVCDPCKIPELHVTDYGFINNHKKLRIVANLGVDTIDAVEIKVKPVK